MEQKWKLLWKSNNDLTRQSNIQSYTYILCVRMCGTEKLLCVGWHDINVKIQLYSVYRGATHKYQQNRYTPARIRAHTYTSTHGVCLCE